MTETDLLCPRCNVLLHEIKEGEALIERCTRCAGSFFDQGEMFAALGTHADPSYWDREETGGVVREGGVKCIRCKSHMLLQDVAYGDDKVVIDRCGHCQGIWLDPGEAEKIMAIGARMVDVVTGERDRQKAELDRMSDPDFRAGGLLYRFLSLFRGKR